MSIICSYKIKKAFLVFILAVGFSSIAHAQTITENQPLSFGRVVLVDNAAGRQIELLAGGGFNADPEYVFFIDPEMGNVTVDGYPAFTPLTVTITTTNVDPLGGGSTNFSTSSTFTNPAVIVTDALGSVTFDVGAILTSDGSGSTHTDDQYEGTYSMTVAP